MSLISINRKNGPFNKIIAILLIQTFIVSTIGFAAPTGNQAVSPKSQEIVTDPEKIVIPREFGLVKSKFTGKDGRLIVHIQDAHCNYEAQSNIAKMLENLIRNDGLKMVSVEGADGIIDTSWFKAFPDDDVRKEVADYFMRKGEITGPEFLSITSDYNFKLFGAETRAYYIDNLNAFTSSYPLKAQTEKYFNEIKSVLNRLKGLIYNEELKNLDQKTQDYESKKLQFNDYVRFLQGMAERHKINLRQYDNFFRLVNVLIYEKKIDFNVTDKERSALIDELSKRIEKDVLNELVTQSLSFKVGKISSAEYYAYLKSLAIKNNIDLAKIYPNLYNYIIYNSVYSKIENEKLFSDIRLVETAIKEKLFQNDDQRTLERLSRHIDTLLGLINIKLLNGDFEYFKAHKDEFTYEAFTDFMQKKTVQFGLSYNIEPPTDSVATSITKLEDFYTIAIKRDKALVENTLNQMNKDRQKIAVLVTGGFHSEGISKLLEKQGISYMVVCPSITKDVPSPYIQILTNQRTPLEDILISTAHAKEQGTLAPPSVPLLISLDDKALKKFASQIIGGEELMSRVERTKKGWLRIFIGGTKGAFEVGKVRVQGYVKDIIQNKLGASVGVVTTNAVLANFIPQLKIRCDNLEPKMSPAKRDALVKFVEGYFKSPEFQADVNTFAEEVKARMASAAGYKDNKAALKAGIIAGRPTPGTQVGGDRTLNFEQAKDYDDAIRESIEEGYCWKESDKMSDEARNSSPAKTKAGERYANQANAGVTKAFYFYIHPGLVEKINKKNEDRIKRGESEIPFVVHPGRGGYDEAGESLGLLQAHIDEYVYNRLTSDELNILARHEIAHHLTFAAEEIYKEEIRKGRTDTEAKVVIDRKLGKGALDLWQAWVAKGRPMGDAQEEFVDSLDGCDITSAGIRQKITEFSNEKLEKGASGGAVIEEEYRIKTSDAGTIDITNCLAHQDGPTSPVIVPQDKGGLTQQELAVELDNIQGVRKDVIESLESGVLNWPTRLKENMTVRRLPGEFAGSKDIIVIGASQFSQALLSLLGTGDKNFYFVNSVSDADNVVKKLEQKANQDDTAIVYISQGVGDAAQEESFNYITSFLHILKHNYLAVTPHEKNEHSVQGRVRLGGGIVIDTPDFIASEGIPFSAEGFAAILAIAGHDKELDKIIEAMNKEVSELITKTHLSRTVPGFLSAVLRGQSRKNVKKFERLNPVPFTVTTVAAYDRNSAIIMRALAEQWNTVLGGRTQLDVAEMPDGQHHQFQMGLSALSHSVINIVPDKYKDIGKDGDIPPYANSSVSSKPDNTFTVLRFMTNHLEALASKTGIGWLATKNPTPNMTLWCNTEKRQDPVVTAASLLTVFQIATLISQKVALANHDAAVRSPEDMARDLKVLSEEIKRHEFSNLAADKDSLFNLLSPAGDVWVDARGVLLSLGFTEADLTSGAINSQGQQILGAALSMQILSQKHYNESKGKTHSFLTAPGIISNPKNNYAAELAKAHKIGKGGKRYYIFAVGGAHNSSVNGMLPSPEYLKGKEVTYIDTLDPAVIKKMCDEIRKDHKGCRFLYISNSGNTDESDTAFRIATRTFREAVRAENLTFTGADAQQKFVGRFAKIAGETDMHTREYSDLRDRTIIVTKEGGGRLRDEMKYVDFVTCPYPLTNGRQSIFELGLINQAFLGVPEEDTAKYIAAADKYVKGMTMLPKLLSAKRTDIPVQKAAVKAHNDAVKKQIKAIETLVKALSEGRATPKEVEEALVILRRDPGMFAGSLIGLLNRPDIRSHTGVELKDMEPKAKLRVIYLSSAIRNEWLVKNDLIESLGKPQIQFVACDNTSPIALNQLAGLADDKESTVLFLVDDGLKGEALKSQNSVLGASENFLTSHNIPYLTVHTGLGPTEHAAATFLLQTMAMGIGGQQITAEGYLKDANHLGEVWVTKARNFVRNAIFVDRMGDKTREEQKKAIRETRGVGDILEQWNLSPSDILEHRYFRDFVVASGGLNTSLFGLARGWDTKFAGNPDLVADEMVKQVIKTVKADENISQMCRAVIVVNPVTGIAQKVELNPGGRYVGVFTADNPIDSAVFANSSDAIFSLFRIDPSRPVKEQELYARINHDEEVDTNLVVQTILKFGAYPTMFVVAPRYGQLAAYNYVNHVTEDDTILFSPKLIGGDHLVAMPTKSSKKSITVVGATTKLPKAVGAYLENLINEEYKGRNMGGVIANAAFIATEGGITGGTQTLLNTFFGHHMFWHLACRGGTPIYFDENGYSDVPDTVTIGEILNGDTQKNVLAIAADKDSGKALRGQLRAAKIEAPNDVQASGELLKNPPPYQGRFKIDGSSFEDVLDRELEKDPLVDASLRGDVVSVMRGLVNIAAVVLPSYYLDPEADEATGTNPSAEVQFKIDQIATDMVERYARRSGKVRAVITEEGEIKRYGIGRIVLVTDPVDGVGNLEAGYPTGQFFSLVDAYTGRVLVTMAFAQGAARAVVGLGDSTHAFQYALKGYKTGDVVDLSNETKLGNGTLLYLGQILTSRDFTTPDNTGPPAPAALGEGGTVLEYAVVQSQAGAEVGYYEHFRKLRDACVAAGSEPSNNGSVVNDTINIVLGADHKPKVYVYPETTSTEAKPGKAGLGGKLRPTEEVAMTVPALGVLNEDSYKRLNSPAGQDEIDERAKGLFVKLLGGAVKDIERYPRAFSEMRRIARDVINRDKGKGLAGTYGNAKNPLYFIPNLDDVKNVPALGAPIFVGAPAYVREFSEASWERFMLLGLVSAKQKALSPEEWNAAEDDEYEVYTPEGVNTYDRRARLKKNPAMGAIKLANGLWVPVVGQDSVRPEKGEAWLDEFAKHQERSHREMMGEKLDSALSELKVPVSRTESTGIHTAGMTSEPAALSEAEVKAPVTTALEAIKTNIASGAIQNKLKDKKGIQILMTEDMQKALYHSGSVSDAGHFRNEQQFLQGVFNKQLGMEGENFVITTVQDWNNVQNSVREGYVPVAWMTETQIDGVANKAGIARLRVVPVASSLVDRMQREYQGKGWFYTRELEAISILLACTTPEEIATNAYLAQSLLRVMNTMVDHELSNVGDLKPLLPGASDERFRADIIKRLLITRPVKAFDAESDLNRERFVGWSV